MEGDNEVRIRPSSHLFGPRACFIAELRIPGKEARPQRSHMIGFYLFKHLEWANPETECRLVGGRRGWEEAA
jgi:hypothetical protein